MTQKVGFWRASLSGAGALLLVGAFASLGLVGCPSGGVGDPCTPEDEFKESFAGFKLTEENIESRSFQCNTRICLVNHFQGRVSCPLGQAKPKVCGQGQTCDNPGEECLPAGAIIKECDPTTCGDGVDANNCNDSNGNNKACGNLPCNNDSRTCECSGSADCPENYFCDSDTKLCRTSVCAKPFENLEDGDPYCFVPGTATPIAVEVCGQCSASTQRPRDADNAVYCSCRCGPPSSGSTEDDENFNFCTCPEGFQCAEIRPNIGLGDAQIAGKYCIKQGTEYKDDSSCGTVDGHWGEGCKGTASLE
jgi:hypothetical protein